MSSPRRGSRWPPVLGLVAAVVVPMLVFASRQGQCLDAASGTGDSLCSSGPSVGWPGAWLVTAACFVLLLACVRRLLRLRRVRD